VKQPDNKQAKMFGNDGPVGNDAEIIVYYEYNGPGMFEHFEAAVHRTAKALKESYTYWPEGYVHVQTIINDEYVNMI